MRFVVQSRSSRRARFPTAVHRRADFFRTTLNYLILTVLLVASVEVSCALGYWSGLVLNEPIYRAGNWPCDGCNANNMSLYDRDLGWKTPMRPTPIDIEPVCGAAYGDSFTHSEEVQDGEAWPFVLSSLLKCKIENFGVGGYGQDQAYLRYLLHKPQGDLIVITLYGEMLRRNHAASWRYYAGMINSLPKPMFRLLNGRLMLEANPPRNDPDAIQRHHQFDRFAAPYKVNFPYTLSLFRVLYYRVFKDQFLDNRLQETWKADDALELSEAILTAFVTNVENSGKRPVILFMPRPAEAAEGQRPYADYIEWVTNMFPRVCVVDPVSDLERASRSGAVLRAPNGHYTRDGNAAIAHALFRELSGRCSGIELNYVSAAGARVGH